MEPPTKRHVLSRHQAGIGLPENGYSRARPVSLSPVFIHVDNHPVYHLSGNSYTMRVRNAGPVRQFTFFFKLKLFFSI